MNGEFIDALQQIAKEKDIPLDTLIETVESALATAYKRNHEINGEIQVRIDSSKAAAAPFKVFCEKLVVEEVTSVVWAPVWASTGFVILLVMILLVRPQGLVGQVEGRKQ